MKLYLLEAAETQGPLQQLTFTDRPPAVACRYFPLCPESFRVTRDNTCFFASMTWDVIIVGRMHNLKSKDYSFKMLHSDKLTL